MKIALYIEDGFEQIVLTPENEIERALMDILRAREKEISIASGSFYDARGGWKCYRPAQSVPMDLGYVTRGAFSQEEKDDTSLMLCLRPKPAPEPTLPPMSSEAALVLDVAREIRAQTQAGNLAHAAIDNLIDAIRAHDDKP